MVKSSRPQMMMPATKMCSARLPGGHTPVLVWQEMPHLMFCFNSGFYNPNIEQHYGLYFLNNVYYNSQINNYSNIWCTPPPSFHLTMPMGVEPPGQISILNLSQSSHE